MQKRNTSWQVLSETDCGKQLQPRQNMLAVSILPYIGKSTAGTFLVCVA